MAQQAQQVHTLSSPISPQSASATSNFRSLFSQALLDYERRTKENLHSHPLASKLKDCDSPDTILPVLEEQTRAIDQSRSNDGSSTQFQWLRPAVDVLCHLSKSTEDCAADMPLSPVTIIFVGIGVLLSAFQAVNASHVTINDTLEKLGVFFEQLAGYIKVPSTSSMTETSEKIMLAVLSILGLVTKEMKQTLMRKYLKKMQWGWRSGIDDALQTLGKLTQEMGEKAGNLNLSGDSNTVTQEDAIRTWLSPSDPYQNYIQARDSRHEGTAQWFLENKTFLEWKSTGLFLWVNGKPGSGKSVISAAIIEHLEAMCKSARASMAYFVFDFKDSQKQSCYQMATSLLTQLSSQSKPYHDMLFSLYLRHERGLRRPSSRAMTGCLKRVLSLPDQGPVYIVLDAIDECPNTHGVPSLREETLGLLRELVELHPPNLRLCVTSRPEWDISAVIDPSNHLRLSLKDEPGQKEDIVKYIADIIHLDPRIRESDKQSVIDTLSERADGMFLWVSCQLDNLRRIAPSAVRRILNELPETLDETYERTLAEINITERQHAHRLFHCLTVAIRPLGVEELAEILAVDFDDGEAISTVNTDWRPVDAEQAVLSICSSLVEVVNLNDSKVVQFSHPSVKEFLTSSRLASSWGRLSSFRVNLELAHTILAQACLCVLLQPDAQRDSDPQRSPLVGYAARYWVDHARFDNVASHIQAGTRQLFDPKKPYFANWVKIYDMDKPLGSPMKTRPNAAPLYYATLCDLPGLADYLIGAYPQDVDARGGQFTTAIHAALYKGHLSIARLLIERGADVNSRDDDDLTPLHIVAQRADASATKPGHSPPLFMASNNARDNNTSTPLQLAVTGTPEIVELLIGHGANLNALDATHSTPLHVALINENLAVVRLLIENGADVNSRDDLASTPLHLASVTGNLDIIKLLIDHGADPNFLDSMQSTPLHVALINENLEVVRLLIESGADVKAPNDKKLTPLHLAAVSGSFDVIELLLQKKADVNSRDDRTSTPLHLASVTGNFKIVELLVEYRADLNALDVTQSTPLHHALVNENFKIARLLIEHGADVNVPDYQKLTPLHLAADSGNLEVTTLLLDRKANANARDNKRSTPLHLASRRSSLDLVKLLLARGADPNAQNDKGWTSLHVASSNKNTKIVALLIEYGANPSLPDANNQTPIQLETAVSSPSERGMARILLARSGSRPIGGR